MGDERWWHCHCREHKSLHCTLSLSHFLPSPLFGTFNTTLLAVMADADADADADAVAVAAVVSCRFLLGAEHPPSLLLPPTWVIITVISHYPTCTTASAVYVCVCWSSLQPHC